MALASLLLFVDPVGGTAFLHDGSDFKTGSSRLASMEGVWQPWLCTPSSLPVPFLQHYLAGTCLVFKTVSCIPGWPPTPYITSGHLDFLVLSPPPPQCRDDRRAPRCLVHVVIGL